MNRLKMTLGAVILMNKFNVSSDEVKEFLEVFAETTKFFKQQPGFISAQVALRNYWEFHIH